MAHDNESIKEAYADFKNGDLSFEEMLQEFDDWDGDPIAVIL